MHCTCFSGPNTSIHTVLIWELFAYGFSRKLHAGMYRSCDTVYYAVDETLVCAHSNESY